MSTEQIEQTSYLNDPALGFPLTLRTISIAGPTLFYIDADGYLIQLQLTNDQVQAAIDDWNTSQVLDHAEEVEAGYAVHELKPPQSEALS